MKRLGLVFIFRILFLTGLPAQNIDISTIGKLPGTPLPQEPAINRPHPNRPPVNPYNPSELTGIQKRNETLINEAVAYEREIQRQIAIKQLLEQGFPSQSYQDPEGTGCFYQAFEEISGMLKGDSPLQLGRAVFLTENAFYGNRLNYSDFQKTIKNDVLLCNQKIKEEKLDGTDNIVKNLMLFRFLSDTLQFKAPGREQSLTHYPVQYDYDDAESKIHFDSHFVTKLMRSNTGQCHSMPLYFLIMAEEIGAEAYWAFSPRHSFVKIKDKKSAWYNIELTCRAILSDAHYMNSGYIKAEAIRNGLYLEPMDKTNIVAESLVNLARYYYAKYGLDDFYLKCLDTAGQYLDNKVDVLMLQSVYETQRIKTLAHLYGAENSDILLERCPQAAGYFEKRQALYQQIDDLGYENLPEELYAIWMQHIAKLKDESDRQKIRLLNIIR